MTRIKTVERDPQGGWIARNPFTGAEYPEDGWRWNCRSSARDVVWQARHLSVEANTYKQLLRLAGLPDGVRGSDPLGEPGVDDGGPYNGLAPSGEVKP